jgi:hypothetical protein
MPPSLDMSFFRKYTAAILSSYICLWKCPDSCVPIILQLPGGSGSVIRVICCVTVYPVDRRDAASLLQLVHECLHSLMALDKPDPLETSTSIRNVRSNSCHQMWVHAPAAEPFKIQALQVA